MEGYEFQEKRSRYCKLEPGDATAYHILVEDNENGTLFVGCNLVQGYWLQKDSVREYGPEIAKGFGKRKPELMMLEHHYVHYLAEAGHMGGERGIANPWTVRACILAAWFALRDWDAADAEAAR